MRRKAEQAGDWLIIAGALLLFGSLFMTWSHQFSKAFLAEWGGSPVLAGVPRDPTAWQVYSIADVLLAVLALALPVVALLGHRRARLIVLAAGAIAIAFVIHAASVPPTDGAAFFPPAGSAVNHPSVGPGEGVAIVGLGAAIAGLLTTLVAI